MKCVYIESQSASGLRRALESPGSAESAEAVPRPSDQQR